MQSIVWLLTHDLLPTLRLDSKIFYGITLSSTFLKKIKINILSLFIINGEKI
jgi:hypothetical protein